MKKKKVTRKLFLMTKKIRDQIHKLHSKFTQDTFALL